MPSQTVDIACAAWLQLSEIFRQSAPKDDLLHHDQEGEHCGDSIWAAMMVVDQYLLGEQQFPHHRLLSNQCCLSGLPGIFDERAGTTFRDAIKYPGSKGDYLPSSKALPSVPGSV